MRRAQGFDPGAQIRVGIIPAYAESTAYLAEVMLAVEDHPRVCGEHLKVTL